MTWSDLKQWAKDNNVRPNTRIRVETIDGSYTLTEGSLRIEEDEKDTRQLIVLDADNLEDE